MENRFLSIKSIGKKLIVFAVISVMLLSIPACTFYPDYEWPTWDEEYGEVLDIDGIVYRTLPETCWEPFLGSQNKKIGNLGSKKSSFGIFAYSSDVDRIFIFTENDSFFADVRNTRFYYRKDIELPELSEDSIDEISFKKWGTSSNSSYDYVVKDRQVIKDVLSLFDITTEEPRVGEERIQDLGLLYFTNSEYPGIKTSFWAEAFQNKYWLSFSKQGFNGHVEISQELLEKLVGEKLPPAKEYLEQQQNSE